MFRLQATVQILSTKYDARRCSFFCGVEPGCKL